MSRKIIIPDRVARRAANRFTPDLQTGCRVSTYSIGSHGYAQIGWVSEDGCRTMTLCHRAAWVYHNHRQIPDGMTVDHLCHNRRCVAPSHLRLLSNFENARRTSGRNWPLGQCVNGHPNSELRMHGGKRVCRVCAKEWHKSYQARRPARRAPPQNHPKSSRYGA